MKSRIDLADLVKKLKAEPVPDRALAVLSRAGASLRFRNGTHVLRIAGVVGTATTGSDRQLIASWLRAAERKLAARAK